MGLYLRGRWYWFKLQIQGKAYYRSLKLKKGQERLLSDRMKQVEEEILAEHFGLPYRPSRNASFKEFLEDYKKSKKYKKTLGRDIQRLNIVCDFWKDPLLQRVGKKHIQDLEKHLFNQHLSSTTVNRYFEILRHFFNLAGEEGIIQENPIKTFVPFVEDAKSRALSLQEIKSILTAARKIQENPLSQFQSIAYDFFSFAFFTGMRLSEILNLKRNYIHDGKIYYPYSGTKSKKRSRASKKQAKIIPLTHQAQEIISRQKDPGDHVFDIQRRNPNIIARTVEKIRTMTKIDDFTFHMIRHTVSTEISTKSDPMSAKIWLGHDDIKTTMKYLHPQLEALQNSATVIENWINEILENPKK